MFLNLLWELLGIFKEHHIKGTVQNIGCKKQTNKQTGFVSDSDVAP